MGGLIQSILGGLPLLASHSGPFVDPTAGHAAACSDIAVFRHPLNSLLSLFVAIMTTVGVVMMIVWVGIMIVRANKPEILQTTSKILLITLVGIFAIDFLARFAYVIAPAHALCG